MAENFPCDRGCGIPGSIQIYKSDGSIYTDGDFAVNPLCKVSPGTSVFDGSLINRAGCVYRPDPRVTKINGVWVLTWDDIRVYRSADAPGPSGVVAGFCPPNLGAWVIDVNCNGSDDCDNPPGTQYPVWFGYNTGIGPLGWYNYIYGYDAGANALLEVR